MRSAIAGVLLLIALPASLPAAGIYKWVDENGRVHYGDRPSGAGAAEINIQAPAAADSPTLSDAERRLKHRRLLDAFEKERADREAQAEKEHLERQRRVRNCAIAKDRLRRVTEAGFLYDVDKNSKRRILSDAERDKATSEAEGTVKRWCG